MTKYDINISLFNIKIHISIFIIIILILFFIVGIFDTFIHFFIFFGLISLLVIHEFGHLLMAKVLNVESEDIYLLPFIGYCSVGEIEYNYQEIIIYSGGILFQIVIFIIGFIFQKMVSNYLVIYQYLDTILLVNIGLILLNLVPVKPLDGYYIFTSIFYSIKSNCIQKKSNILKFKKRANFRK